MAVREVRWKAKKKGAAGAAWLVAYRDQNGKRRFKNFRLKKDAVEYEATVRVEVRQGIHTPPSESITVAEAGARWIAYAEREQLEPSTIAQYKQHLRLHIEPRLGKEKLSRLTAPRVNAFANDLIKATSRPLARKVLTSLKGILREAQVLGDVAQNVALSVKISTDREKRERPHITAGVDFPTPDEVKRLLAAATGKWRALLTVAAFTGLRASELRGLTWGAINLKKRELTVSAKADCYRQLGDPKSRASRRTVPFGDGTRAALKEWHFASAHKADTDLVFPMASGAIDHHQNLLRGIAPIMKAAKVVNKKGEPKYALHAFRHFFASWCLNPKEQGGRGMQLNVVKELMGHSSIVITQDVYGHLFPRGDDRSEIDSAERALMA